MFNCENVGDNYLEDLRMSEDYSVSCWTKNHKKWSLSLGLIGLILLGFCFPLYLLGKLIHYNRNNKLKNMNVRFKFGYFYYAFKEKYYFWDIVILVRRFLIIFINIYFFNSINNKELFPVCIILALLVIALFIHNEAMPYNLTNFNDVNYLEEISLISLSVTVFFGLIF